MNGETKVPGSANGGAGTVGGMDKGPAFKSLAMSGTIRPRVLTHRAGLHEFVGRSNLGEPTKLGLDEYHHDDVQTRAGPTLGIFEQGRASGGGSKRGPCRSCGGRQASRLQPKQDLATARERLSLCWLQKQTWQPRTTNMRKARAGAEEHVA
jgi:hypothetical protein